MCGICGIVTADPNAPARREPVQRMTDLLRHRGPDGEGYFLDEGVALGMRRLSIVDLAPTGAQPIPNEDGTVQVICNGEIYNAPELMRELEARGHRFRGHSDVEVVAHLYEEAGGGCVDRLRGMFALAVWDRRQRRLLLARDRLGIKPLYYARAENGDFLFASEAKSILAAGGVDSRINPEGLAGLLYFGGALFDQTLFRGIRQLEPGWRLVIRGTEERLEQYWDLDFDAPPALPLPTDEKEWAELVHEKLREAVRIHLRGDVPVSCWLSAGIDSSAVAYLGALELGQELPTFSLGFEDPRFDELEGQRTLDQFPGFGLRGTRVPFGTTYLPHLPEAVWHREQPVHHQFSYQVLGARTWPAYKVALTGQGSDEVFGGYPWYGTDRRWRWLYPLPGPARKALARLAPRLSAPDRRAIGHDPALTPHRFAALQWTGFPQLRPLLDPDLLAAVDEAHEALRDWKPPEGFRGWTRTQQLQYVEMKTRLPSYINLGLDASSMAHSVEPRLPFLDHELVELCLHLPDRLRHRGAEKQVLRKAMEPHLPPEIVWRRKRGLHSPDAIWKGDRSAAPPFVLELLSEAQVTEKGYFRPHAVEALKRERKGVDVALAAVVGFHLWDELFRSTREVLTRAASAAG